MIGYMEVNGPAKHGTPLGIAARDGMPHDIFRTARSFLSRPDRRFPGPPGKVGLWTKADSMTWFESLKIGSLD